MIQRWELDWAWIIKETKKKVCSCGPGLVGSILMNKREKKRKLEVDWACIMAKKRKEKLEEKKGENSVGSVYRVQKI